MASAPLPAYRSSAVASRVRSGPNDANNASLRRSVVGRAVPLGATRRRPPALPAITLSVTTSTYDVISPAPRRTTSGSARRRAVGCDADVEIAVRRGEEPLLGIVQRRLPRNVRLGPDHEASSMVQTSAGHEARAPQGASS